MLWFNPRRQPAPRSLPLSWWDAGENWKKVQPMGRGEKSLRIKKNKQTKKPQQQWWWWWWRKWKEQNKTQEKEVMDNTIAHRALMPNPCLVRDWWLLANSPSFYAEYDILRYGISLWPVQVSCPSWDPSQILVHLLSGRGWEHEKPLT